MAKSEFDSVGRPAVQNQFDTSVYDTCGVHWCLS